MDKDFPTYKLAKDFRKTHQIFSFLLYSFGVIMNVLTVLSFAYLLNRQEDRLISIFIFSYAIYVIVFLTLYFTEECYSDRIENAEKEVRQHELSSKVEKGYQSLSSSYNIHLESKPNPFFFQKLKIRVIEDDTAKKAEQKDIILRGRVNYLYVSPKSIIPRILFYLSIIFFLGFLGAIIILPKKGDLVFRLKKNISSGLPKKTEESLLIDQKISEKDVVKEPEIPESIQGKNHSKTEKKHLQDKGAAQDGEEQIKLDDDKDLNQTRKNQNHSQKYSKKNKSDDISRNVVEIDI